MLLQTTPRGLPVNVPSTLLEDPSPRFGLDQLKPFRSYYDEHGYAIIGSMFEDEHCDEIRGLWNTEVKPSESFIYRQATAKAEKHSFNEKGWVMNPILNLQSVSPKNFPHFRKFASEKILTHPSLRRAFHAILDEDPKVVQSMYFEGNSATWEHQDTYYLDSEQIGRMAGVWIALEDIAPDAGRFFVCDRSHRINLGLQEFENNIVDFHEEYISNVVSRIKEDGLEIRAPYLRKGDVLFWNSRTIHGSLDSHSLDHSRSSITVHAIPESHRFLQLQNRIAPLNVSTVNGVQVHRPKDLSRTLNRTVLMIESRFPDQFYFIKSAVIRTMIKMKNNR